MRSAVVEDNDDELEWGEYGRIPGVTMLGSALCVVAAIAVAALIAFAAYLEL